LDFISTDSSIVIELVFSMPSVLFMWKNTAVFLKTFSYTYENFRHMEMENLERNVKLLFSLVIFYLSPCTLLIGKNINNVWNTVHWTVKLLHYWFYKKEILHIKSQILAPLANTPITLNSCIQNHTYFLLQNLSQNSSWFAMLTLLKIKIQSYHLLHFKRQISHDFFHHGAYAAPSETLVPHHRTEKSSSVECTWAHEAFLPLDLCSTDPAQRAQPISLWFIAVSFTINYSFFL